MNTNTCTQTANPPAETTPATATPKQPKLLDQLRQAIRVRHYSIRTEHTYADWVVQFIRFHGTRHPKDMGALEINQFLSHLATDRNVAASTQNQALCAIVFLYKHVLGIDVADLGEVVRAKRPARLPVVLTVEETERILSHLNGIHKLMALLLYGAGMRIMEVIRLRVKDIDFGNKAIIVRDGKGEKDRPVPLPQNTVEALAVQIAKVKQIHDQDLRDGYGSVYLPYALDKKYPNTHKAFHWQYVFPSHVLSTDPRSGRRQRHHVFESVLQDALKTATRQAGVRKDVHAHTLRHSFASHLLASGTDIRTIQQLLGHVDVSTTMIYTHIMKTGPLGIVSPSDRLRLDTADLTAPRNPKAGDEKSPAPTRDPAPCLLAPPADSHARPPSPCPDKTSPEPPPEKPPADKGGVPWPQHEPRVAERLCHAFNVILALIFPRLLAGPRGGLS